MRWALFPDGTSRSLVSAHGTREPTMVRRSLRHPIRGDRRYPKPPRQPRRGTKRSRERQPRMRPRRGPSVAALVGSPEEETSRPNLRLRVVGIAVLVLFGVLVVRLWTLQVIDAKTYAAQVTRNQVRVVAVSPSRGQIVDRNNTVLAGGQPQEEILLSRVSAAQNPSVVAKVAALIGQTPQAGADDRQQRSVRSVRAHTAGHGDTGRHGAVPPGPPVRLPGRVGGAGHHTAPTPGRQHGGPCTGLPRRHHQHLSQCAQERRVRPRQPGGDLGHRGAVRDLPARGQRAPGARGGRVGQRGRHACRAPPRRRATRWC